MDGRVDPEALLGWFRAYARDLPWRRTRDPYRLLVSEVMLQQTPVARAAPAYERFLAEFPDAAALASAAPAAVLRAWTGLGYNRRALALRAAARRLEEDGWPTDAEGLRALPGVGPYTAAAVASFAWDEPVAAVDTNVRRVIERLDGTPRGPAALRRRAAELLPGDRAAEWNQAMMELGARVCRPRTPRCGECPLATGCAGPGPARPPRRRGAAGGRWEGSDRWARGRVVAALVADRPLPELPADRREAVLAGLERDGLVERSGETLTLPSG